MFKSGITVRWLITTILVIAVILVGFAAMITFSMKDYYYTTVEKKLQAMGQSSTLADYFSEYFGSSNDVFSERAKEYVENFSETNTAEVWIYNKYGEVVVTSTGFPSDSVRGEDYAIAMESPSGRGICRSELSSGERIMALTVLLPKTGEEMNGAVRYISSLQDIDAQVRKVAVLVLSGCLFAFLLVVISGLFFIRSIVEPVKKINAVTRKIAAGNYDEKVIVTNKSDEIAELSESINYMTDEIVRTDRMKNDFISTVSHELRTPLTAIKGWTETLIDMNETDDPTLKEGLRVILSESERLYSLVEDLLDFSRMESGRMTLRLKKIDILAELDEAVYVLRDRAAREGIDIFYSTPDYSAPMNGDPDRLKQVFVNVIENAIKYTPIGGKISIVAVLTTKNLKITVADTGCGISEEDLPHVKKKFYKANVSAKGSGIGLAVCDEIISRHKGTLDIKSALGEGTQVIITLPTHSVNLIEGKEN